MSYENQAAPRGAEGVLAEKWGTDVILHGYTAVPDLLLAHMGALKISPTELAVLLQLMRYWWAAGQLPFPSKKTLAQAMGASEKNVQRVVGRLVRRGLLKRIERKKAGDRNDSNCYDFGPLIGKLKPLAALAARELQDRLWEMRERAQAQPRAPSRSHAGRQEKHGRQERPKKISRYAELNPDAGKPYIAPFEPMPPLNSIFGPPCPPYVRSTSHKAFP